MLRELALMMALTLGCATTTPVSTVVTNPAPVMATSDPVPTVTATNQVPSFIQMLLEAGAGDAPVDAECPEDGNCVSSYRFDGYVDEDSVSKAVKWLDAWEEAGAKALVIEINTPGGSVSDGFTLARRIEDAKIPIHCVVDGEAASMGFYLLQSCTTREMTKRSTLMAHTPSLSGGVEDARQPQFNNYAEMMRVMADSMAEHCSKRLKTSVADYKYRTRDGAQWWMNWQDSVQYGAVDQLVDSAKAVTAALEKNLKLPDPLR